MNLSRSPRSAARRLRGALGRLVNESDPTRLIALLTLLGFVAIVASAVLAHFTDDKWRDDLWLEVGKAGVQVVAVGVLGGALAAIWRNVTASRESAIAERAKERDREYERMAKERDREIERKEKERDREYERMAKERDRDMEAISKERDREIERNDKIRAELVSLVEMYNGVKAVRRTLRSLGFDPKTYASAKPVAGSETAALTLEQVRGFQEQMLILNRLQLDFESKARQFGQTDLLGDDTEKVVKLLGGIESHLNRILELWEHRGWTLEEGTPVAVVSDGLTPLFRVRSHLRPQVSEPLREITRIINKHVFGEATEETQDALQGIVSAHEKREPDDDRGTL